MVDIVIPTIRSHDEITPQLEAIMSSMRFQTNRIFATCQKVSASINRNSAVSNCRQEIVVMLDDDITGFFNGWDEKLIAPLFSVAGCVMVSARLMKADGITVNTMMDYSYPHETPLEIVNEKELPGACIAFRASLIDEISQHPLLRANKPFDEAYVRGGFEDNDFCKAVQLVRPNGVFVINNNCRLIHLQEEKWKVDGTFTRNRDYFNNKWGEARYTAFSMDSQGQ